MSKSVKGRLKLPGQEVDIPFTLIREHQDAFDGFVANTTVVNTFYKSSGWIFEADKPSTYELVEALDPGTVFVFPAGGPGGLGAVWQRINKGVRLLHTDAAARDYENFFEAWHRYDYVPRVLS